MVSPEVNDRGEVSLEGHLIGSIEGLRFTLARSDGGDAKGLHTAASQAIAPEIDKRAERLAGAPNEEIVLGTDGYVRWRGEVVANLAEGETLLAPRLLVLADESLTGPALERVQERLNLWLRHSINTQLEPVVALAEPADLEGAARGIAFRLSENLGLLPRSAVADEVKGLDQDVRGKMRKLGVKFGAYHIYVPLSLKPAPRELALILHALKHGGVRQPGVAELPQIVLSGRTSFLIDPEVDQRLYEVAGFKVAGRRAVRVDILERLADIIRPLIAFDPAKQQGEAPTGAAEGNGFRVTVEMTSLLGTAGEDFASILNSLGYRVRRTPKAPPVPRTDEAELNSEAKETVEGALPRDLDADPPATETAAIDDATADLGASAPPPEHAGEDGTGSNLEEADAEANSAAKDAVEGALPAAADAPSVATAGVDPGASAPETAATPAEPEFDEVWYPAGRRPDQSRQPGRRAGNQSQRAGDAAADGTVEGETRTRPSRHRNGDGKGRPRRDGKPAGHHDGKGKAPANGAGRAEDRPQRQRRDVPLDPDSPWAALAALRNPKSE